jgi:hypothetical protein
MCGGVGTVAVPDGGRNPCPVCRPRESLAATATAVKTADPKRVALLDKMDKARLAFERAYSRMKRAFKAMEKARLQLLRLQRRLDRS